MQWEHRIIPHTKAQSKIFYSLRQSGEGGSTFFHALLQNSPGLEDESLFIILSQGHQASLQQVGQDTQYAALSFNTFPPLLSLCNMKEDMDIPPRFCCSGF